MDNVPDRIDSRFRYVLLAAERAEHMMRGAPPKLERPKSKVTRIAMEEVADDILDWDYGPAPEATADDEEAESEA